MKKNNYKIDLVRCKICGYETNNHQAFNSHLSKRHHIKSKEYYDIYLKSDIDGICKECGNPTAFKNMWDGYRDFCCNSCAQKNIDIQNKKIKTSLENFGTVHPMKSDVVKAKLKDVFMNKYGVENPFQSEEVKEKIKEISLKKYNVDNPAKSEEVKEKTKQTNLKKYGVEWVSQNSEIRQKQIDTLYKNFGVVVPCKSKIIKEKVKNTCQEKYGVDCVLQLEEIREKTYNTAYTSEARSNAAKTMRKNGNRSKLEAYFEDLLTKLNINYKVEYKEERYPYFCDFYLPDTDTFIEINGYWTHNDHIFDKNNKEDLKTLEFWKKQANLGKTQYKTAIKVWSILDVDKYNCAIKNQLNFIILWNKQDIERYINTLI